MYQQGTEETAEQQLIASRAVLKALNSCPQKEEAVARAVRSGAATAERAQARKALTLQRKPYEEPDNNAHH